MAASGSLAMIVITKSACRFTVAAFRRLDSQKQTPRTLHVGATRTSRDVSIG